MNNSLTSLKPRSRGIVGVDFDGTIAEQYWNNVDIFFNPNICGQPIPGAIEFIKKLAAKYDVVIFTARACQPEHIPVVRRWIVSNKLTAYILDITNAKTYNFVAIVDDRALRFENPSDYQSILDKLL